MPYTNPSFYSIDYNRSLYSYQLMGDLLDNTNAEARVKMRNQYYLPMPAAFALANATPATSAMMHEGSNGLTNNLSDQISNQYNPNWHANSLYAAYKTRGRMPSITDYTFRALMSTINKRRIVLTLPPELKDMEEEIYEVYDKIVRKVLRDGTIWTAVDIDKKTNKPTIKTYEAVSVPKWEQDKYVIFRENAPSIENPFQEDVWKDQEYIYKYLYIENENYTIETRNGTFLEEGAKVVPSYLGNPLKEIPVECIGSTSLDWGVDQIPLLGIGNIAIQIYQKNCDLANSQFLSCSPMLVFSGIDKGDDEAQGVGSGLAVYLPPYEAKAYYTKTDTSALEHVTGDIESLFIEAGKLGWALMGINKKSAESAAALQARTSANDATVQSITLNASLALVNQLKIIARWKGLSESAINSIAIDTNLVINSAVLSSSDILALANLWEKKALGWKTLFANVKNSQMIGKSTSWEDELDDIMNGHRYEPPVDVNANLNKNFDGKKINGEKKKKYDGNGPEINPKEDSTNSSGFRAPVGDEMVESLI